LKRTKQTLLALCALVGGLYAADPVARKLVHHDDPEYPTIAAKMALHGTVKLRVWIAPDGTVRRLEYIGGHPLLAESAVKAVKGWKFDSAEKESSEIVEVKF
jgi:TonB family protein